MHLRHALVKTGSSWHGFLEDKSCLANLLEFFEEIGSTVDKGESEDFDFQKAFDKMRLLNRARAHGITGKTLAWMKWLIGKSGNQGIEFCLAAGD